MEALAHFVAAYAPLIVAAVVVGGVLTLLLVLSWGSRYGAALAGLSSSRVAPMLIPLAGFALIAVALIAFGELAEGIGPGEDLHRFDRALEQALRNNRSPVTQSVLEIATHLGGGVVLSVLGVAVGVALLARRELTWLYAWIVAVGGTGLLNRLLKEWFERDRPGDVPLLATWSFPSGHAMNSLVAYGMLAYLALRMLPQRFMPAVVGAAVAVVLVVGASRILLHYHYFSDVLAGYAAGLAWLTVCITAAALAERRSRRRHTP